MASERATALADDFASVNEDAVAFARSCGDEDWMVVVPGEGWTVGVLLHHIAEGHAHGLEWLAAMASGQPVTDTAEGIDDQNAEHARRAASVDRAETVELLVRNGTALEAALRALSDVELDTLAPFGPAGGRELPTEALAAVAARHAREHLGHARDAVDGAS